jgi:hypothetical protein
MAARGMLSLRHGRPITIPSRPVLRTGVRTTSVRTASGSVQGSGGTAGASTDLTIENLEAREVDAVLSFTSFSGRTARPLRLRLEPFETREMADVLSGFPEDGTFRIESADGSSASLALSARSYERDEPFREVGSSFLAGLAQTDAFDALLEASGDPSDANPESFEARLRSADGSLIGVRALEIPAGGGARWAISELFPGAWGDALSLEISANEGSRVPEVRAAETDLRTGDRVEIPAARAAGRLYLPATGRTETSSGSSLATDATVFNASDAPMSVRLRFLEQNRDNAAAESATLLLGPRESRRLDEIVGTFFGAVEVAGVLEIEAPGVSLVVVGTQTARVEGGPGTVRSLVATVDAPRFARTSALTSSDGSLGRVTVFNSDGAPLAASLRWLAPDGTIVSEASVVVPPRSSVTAEGSRSGGADRVMVSTERPHFAFVDRADTIGRDSGEVRPRTRAAR